jgi:hypothetical protein
MRQELSVYLVVIAGEMEMGWERALGHFDAQLEQFSPDPFSTPGAIVFGHGLDRGDNILSQRLTACLPFALRLSSPNPSKEIAVPTQLRIGLNDHEGCLPGRQLPGDEDKQSPVTPREGRAFDLSLEHDELLTEASVCEHQFRLVPGKVQDGIEGQRLVVRLGPTTEMLLDIGTQGI